MRITRSACLLLVTCFATLDCRAQAADLSSALKPPTDESKVSILSPQETPQSQAAPPPQAGDPRRSNQDLYQSSFSRNVYNNQFFGFSVTLQDGWQHSDLADLRQEDERKQAEQVDAWVKNLGPKGADIIKSGVLTIPRVYTLLLSRSDPVSSPLGQDPLMIIVKVNSRTPFLKENPELYFQENEWFRSNEVKSLSKLVHVSYGGRDFAQGDFKFKENRKDHFARVLATCEKEYYLVFQFVGSNAADVELVSEVAKSIRFDATAKEKR